MLLIKLLFVAASLITQGYIFRDSPEQSLPSPSASYEADARRADSTMYVTYGFSPSAGENRSTAGSDTLPNGEPRALR